MKYSLTLGRPFGIKISVHWTFILLIIYVIAVTYGEDTSMTDVIMSVVFILALFVCVTLHELGHALTARRYGIETKGITLLPIGGMAKIPRMPEKPGQEIKVAIAGPIVNVVIAAAIYAVIAATPGPNLENMELQKITAQNFWLMLMYINVFIVVFNMIPAFPMDGGRILRGALSYKYDRLKATKYASVAGQVFGVIFGIGGLFVNPFLAIIGIFVFFGARMEYAQLRMKSSLGDSTAKDIVMKDYDSIDKEKSVEDASDKMKNSKLAGFVVTNDGDVVGVLSKSKIIDSLSGKMGDKKVEELMNTDFKGIESDTPLKEVLDIMNEKKADIMPVMEDGEVIGVIDQDHLQEHLMVESAKNGS